MFAKKKYKRDDGIGHYDNIFSLSLLLLSLTIVNRSLFLSFNGNEQEIDKRIIRL